MKFTAKQAREIKESHRTSLGRVTDELRRAAKNGKDHVTIENLSLELSDKKEIIDAGFNITGNTISF